MNWNLNYQGFVIEGFHCISVVIKVKRHKKNIMCTFFDVENIFFILFALKISSDHVPFGGSTSGNIYPKLLFQLSNGYVWLQLTFY